MSWKISDWRVGTKLGISFTALVLLSVVAMAGELASVAAVVQFALVFLIAATVWAVGGDQMARASVGPLSFLLFAVPFGQEALPVLMNWTADRLFSRPRFRYLKATAKMMSRRGFRLRNIPFTHWW